jgi:hypothetical protein
MEYHLAPNEKLWGGMLLAVPTSGRFGTLFWEYPSKGLNEKPAVRSRNL